MNSSTKLQLIDEKVSNCQLCKALASTRTKTVPGEGPSDARILYLGEAPGWEEDEEGRPFIGQSGQRLRKITTEIGWNPEDIYITNILKCRPPYNRTPKTVEMSKCDPYLRLQIEVVRPELIVCWGKVAAWGLLKPTENFEFFRINSVRGEIHEYRGAKVLCTYHPSYVIRDKTSEAHNMVVNDLKFFQEKTGIYSSARLPRTVI